MIDVRAILEVNGKRVAELEGEAVVRAEMRQAAHDLAHYYHLYRWVRNSGNQSAALAEYGTKVLEAIEKLGLEDSLLDRAILRYQIERAGEMF